MHVSDSSGLRPRVALSRCGPMRRRRQLLPKRVSCIRLRLLLYGRYSRFFGKYSRRSLPEILSKTLAKSMEKICTHAEEHFPYSILQDFNRKLGKRLKKVQRPEHGIYALPLSLWRLYGFPLSHSSSASCAFPSATFFLPALHPVGDDSKCSAANRHYMRRRLADVLRLASPMTQ